MWKPAETEKLVKIPHFPEKKPIEKKTYGKYVFFSDRNFSTFFIFHDQTDQLVHKCVHDVFLVVYTITNELRTRSD